MNLNFRGAMTAIVTPFRDGEVDEKALRELVEWQIAEGIDALVPCGTTGEASTLSAKERALVIKTVCSQARGRVPIIAGAGSNNTSHAIELTKLVKDAGADASLQVTPYYNKPPQEGLFLHFSAIAKSADLPLILYNVPGRTAVNMTSETTVRLSEIKNIIGIKEASGNLDQISSIIKNTPEDFIVLSGEDAQNVEIYKRGGKGCISVTGNVAPAIVSKIWKNFEAGKIHEAEKTQSEIAELNAAMFYETNPIPAKTALFLMGRAAEEFRLPLTRMSDQNRIRLKEVLGKYAIIQ